MSLSPSPARATPASGTTDSWSVLAETVLAGGKSLQVVGDGFTGSGLVTARAAGPIEVVIGLDQRSLAAEQSFRRETGRPVLDRAGERAYVASLAGAHAPLRSFLQTSGAVVVADYRIVFNGVAAVVDPATASRLASVPGVTSVRPTVRIEPDLGYSVPFILGGESYADLGGDGTGITIAVIDTGIDYTHASLGGSGIPADYAANDPTIVEPGTFPTAKVIGGTDLVGEWYASGCPPVPPTPGVCSSIPMPDPDPLDLGGHGSHVSGIAAGVGSSGVPHGVAPGASLYGIKVFALGSTSSAIVAAALEKAADPNGDGDTSDAVDVVNMSLGSAFGRDTELGAVASNAAVDAGIAVVASAGNSGDIPYITGSPAVASQAISVAAGNDPGLRVQQTMVSGSLGGVADGDYESIEGAFTPPLTTTGPKSGLTTFVGQACSSFPAGSLAGMIPLIERGVCRFDAKVKNVELAGAIGAVVYNNLPGSAPIAMGGDPIVSIPAVMVGNLDGLKIRNAIGPATTITLDPANQLPIPDRLQGFTSRGPRLVDSALKPDISAPGGTVLSVAAGTGTGGVSFSGTSMSSPHIAGAAAILRQLHPDWTPEEIKAVLMNTATNASPGGGVAYRLSLMGAGRVRVDVAADSESLVVPPSVSLGVHEDSSHGRKVLTTVLEVRNKGTASKTFAVSSAFLFANDDEGSIEVRHADTLTVGPGHKKPLQVQLMIDSDLLAPESAFEEYEIFLTLTETTSGGDVLRVPIHIIPYARAAAHANLVSGGGKAAKAAGTSTLVLRNDGLRATNADVYQLGVEDPNEDLIAEASGMPEDPDDWFDAHETGAHAFDSPTLGRIVEFAITTWGRRSVANYLTTTVFLDLDGGGADYAVQVTDLGMFSTPPFFDGRIASAIVHLASNARVVRFLVTDDRNTALETAPFRVADLNNLAASRGGPSLIAANPSFSYWVTTMDMETGATDTTDAATFDAFAPAISAFPYFLPVPPGEKVTTTVTATTGGALLVLFYNNDSGVRQSQVVRVHG